MHYYQHHIGDYRKDTSHLNLLEHGIYRQLLDWYYLDESPLPPDIKKIRRSVSARKGDEKDALDNVLADFFELDASGYTHSRCDRELERIYDKSEKARVSVQARWDKKKAKDEANDTTGIRSAYERNTDVKQNATKPQQTHTNGILPNNPIPNTHKESKTLEQTPFDSFWSCYPKKKNKGTAIKAWKRLKLGNGHFDKVMEGLSAAKQSPDWLKDNGQFIPYPASWLNATGWEDEHENQRTTKTLGSQHISQVPTEFK